MFSLPHNIFPQYLVFYLLLPTDLAHLSELFHPICFSKASSSQLLIINSFKSLVKYSSFNISFSFFLVQLQDTKLFQILPITSISMSASILRWHMHIFNQTTSNVFFKLLVSILQSILTMNFILNKDLHSNFTCYISQCRKVSLELYSWVWWSTKLLQLHTLPPKRKNLPMQSMPSSLLI